MRGRLAQGEPDKARSDIRSQRRPFLRSAAGYLLIVTLGMISAQQDPGHHPVVSGRTHPGHRPHATKRHIASKTRLPTAVAGSPRPK